MLLNKSIPLKYILNKIKIDIAITVVFTAAIIILRQIFKFNYDLPVAVPAFLGTAISLVLAFKINQSYDRWWEARKIWGAIVNDSRSLIVQLLHFHKDTESKSENLKVIAYKQIAWCYALSNSLRKLFPLENAKKFLSPEDLKYLSTQNNNPLGIINLNSQLIKSLHEQKLINDFQQVQLDNTYVRLCASMGKAERIKNTVFPKTYRIFLRFFVYIFLTCLAISLSDLNSIFVLVLLIAIALSFFLLMKTAHHMQDPFENRPTDTAMNQISMTIETNIRQLLGEKNVPQTDYVYDFYSM